MPKHPNPGPQGRKARARWLERQVVPPHPHTSDPAPDAEGEVLLAGWQTFFKTLGVRPDCGFTWRGGADNLTFAPSFWIPAWRKAIDVRARLPPNTPLDVSSRIVFDWIRPGGVFTQYTQDGTLLIAGEPWPGKYQLIPLLPAVDQPGSRASASLVPFLHPETALGIAPNSGRIWITFGQSRDAIVATLDDISAANRPDRAPLLPMDFPWMVVGGQAAFHHGDAPDPRVTDSRTGLYFALGDLDESDVASRDTRLNEAYLAARARIITLQQEGAHSGAETTG